jgi:hypothetical protein
MQLLEASCSIKKSYLYYYLHHTLLLHPLLLLSSLTRNECQSSLRYQVFSPYYNVSIIIMMSSVGENEQKD